MAKLDEERLRKESAYWQNWKPDPAHINALPERVRAYVHDLETRADPAGDLRTIAELKENNAALLKLVEELKQEVLLLQKR